MPDDPDEWLTDAEANLIFWGTEHEPVTTEPVPFPVYTPGCDMEEYEHQRAQAAVDAYNAQADRIGVPSYGYLVRPIVGDRALLRVRPKGQIGP